MWQALHHGSDVAISWDPSGSSCDVNNHTSGGGHTAAAVVPHRVGAVVVQAWPGRQRGYQPRQLLVAGGYAQLELCVDCLHGGWPLHCMAWLAVHQATDTALPVFQACGVELCRAEYGRGLGQHAPVLLLLLSRCHHSASTSSTHHITCRVEGHESMKEQQRA
jgi:hypothetical protein